jgi:hypothetical protein
MMRRFPVYENNWAFYKTFFICISKGSRFSYGISVVKGKEGFWKISHNASYYTSDLGKENMPKVGLLDIADLIGSKIVETFGMKFPERSREELVMDISKTEVR